MTWGGGGRGGGGDRGLHLNSHVLDLASVIGVQQPPSNTSTRERAQDKMGKFGLEREDVIRVSRWMGHKGGGASTWGREVETQKTSNRVLRFIAKSDRGKGGRGGLTCS